MPSRNTKFGSDAINPGGVLALPMNATPPAQQTVFYDLSAVATDVVKDIYRIDVVELQGADGFWYVWLGNTAATNNAEADLAAKSAVWLCSGYGTIGGAKQTLWVPRNFAVSGSGNDFPLYIGATAQDGDTWSGSNIQIALNCYRASGASRFVLNGLA